MAEEAGCIANRLKWNIVNHSDGDWFNRCGSLVRVLVAAKCSLRYAGSRRTMAYYLLSLKVESFRHCRRSVSISTRRCRTRLTSIAVVWLPLSVFWKDAHRFLQTNISTSLLPFARRSQFSSVAFGNALGLIAEDLSADRFSEETERF